MNREARTALSSCQRVQQFIAQLPAADAPSTLGAQVAELDDVVSRLSSTSVDQEAGRRFVHVHAESRRNFRRALYMDHMQPIARVAREVFGLSGMDRAFRMPPKSVADKTLLAAAGAMAEAAEKGKDVLVKHGLSQDVVEQLKAAAGALENAQSAKSDSGRRRVTATAAVREICKHGRKAVRLLNAILQPRLAKDPELLAAWRSAMRVPRVTVGAPEAVSASSSVKVA